MLTVERCDHILAALPRRRIGVIGDLFLDRYFDLDARLSEPSLETGLDAYQVTHVRSYPGAAGTVINNLAALGVGTIVPLAVIGDDGEGYELVQALRGLPAVRLDHVLRLPQRRTPTYIKPMLHEPGRPPRELNRLDIKNRTPLPAAAEEGLIDALAALWPTLDALLVLDQVSEAECGVVTTCVRDRLAQLGAACPERLILADSRERIRAFVDMTLKPNVAECRGAVGDQADEATAAALLAQRARRTVYCTCGPRGIWVAEPGQAARLAPAPPVAGPIDTVGAGDSTSAGLACALTCGASPVEAAAFANLIASITIRQLGVTGTATPDQVRRALAGLP